MKPDWPIGTKLRCVRGKSNLLEGQIYTTRTMPRSETVADLTHRYFVSVLGPCQENGKNEFFVDRFVKAVTKLDSNTKII